MSTSWCSNRVRFEVHGWGARSLNPRIGVRLPYGLAAAADCAHALRDPARALGAEYDIALDVGANVHLATVVEGVFGRGPSAAQDVVGAGVIHTYRMGAGAGIRISEPVYRKLPNDARAGWNKHQPPATYTASE